MSGQSPVATSPASQLRDVVVVALLVVLVLLGLDDSFATREYLAVGCVGAAAALAVAAMVAGVGRGTEIFLLVATPAYVVVGTMAAIRGGRPIGVPTPAAMVDLLAATITAPGDFLTTIPPVDAGGGVMVLPYTIGFVTAGASGWLALRTRRSIAPVLPLVLGLVLTILLGTVEPDRLQVRSVLFAGVVLWWISLRATQSAGVRHAHRGQVFRALAVTVLVATLAVALDRFGLPGRDGTSAGERTVLRGHVGSGTDVSRADNPLSDIRRYHPRPASLGSDVADDVLLRVRGLPGGSRLRFVTLDQYDGSVWSAGNRTVAGVDDALFQRIGSEIDSQRRGKRVTVNIEVREPYGSSWLPLAGELTSLSFDYSDGRAQREDVRYNLATDSAYVRGGVAARDDYTFTAVMPNDTLRPDARAFRVDAPLVDEGEFLDLFLFAWIKSDMTPMERVRSVARYLRKNGRYSDGVLPAERQYVAGHDQDRLGFGFVAADQIVGNDEQYAATMALAANRLMVPARVVVGAIVPRNGRVRGRDVSAWVEVRVADGTWRTLDTREFMSHEPPERTAEEVERPTEHLRGEGEEPDLKDPDEEAAQGVRDEGARRPESGDADSFDWTRLVPLFGLLPLLVPLLKLVRRRRRRAAPQGRWSAPFVGGWREIVDAGRDAGLAVSPTQTRVQQADALGIGPRLALIADGAIYAPRSDPDMDARAFWSDVESERRAIRRRSGLVRRLWAPFNPRSLRRG